MVKDERNLLKSGGSLRLYTFVFVKGQWRRVKKVAAEGSGTRCCSRGGYPLSVKLGSKRADNSQTINVRRYNSLLLAK